MEPRNVKFTLEYDGTAFAGWQVQPGQRTVQGVLEDALGDLCARVAAGDTTRTPVANVAVADAARVSTADTGGRDAARIPVTGAGRTDSGVHAIGQVANAHVPLPMPPVEIACALNARLPDDLFVRSAEEVGAGFNARYDAMGRSYVYLIGRERSPLWRSRRWHVRGELDVEAMEEAALTLVGENDFSSFCLAGSEPSHHRCRVDAISLEWDPRFGGMLVFRVEANRFLRGMVRSLVGTLVDVGRGKMTPLRFAAIMPARDRGRAGITAPAHGLYLEKVTY